MPFYFFRTQLICLPRCHHRSFCHNDVGISKARSEVEQKPLSSPQSQPDGQTIIEETPPLIPPLLLTTNCWQRFLKVLRLFARCLLRLRQGNLQPPNLVRPLRAQTCNCVPCRSRCGKNTEWRNSKGVAGNPQAAVESAESAGKMKKSNLNSAKEAT